MRSARLGSGAGEEGGEGAGGFRLGGGEPGCERQLVDAGAGDQAGEFGEQRGVREDRPRQKAGGGLAGSRVAVVPEVRGQGVGEPAVDVGLDVVAGAAGQFVAYGFVALAGLGLLQRAELAQRLELIGAGRDPGGFAQFGFPGGGGRGVGGELGLDDVVGVRVVDGARGRGGEQLGDAFPLRELRRAADVVGARSSCRESCRASNRASSRAAATAPASMPLARRRTTRRPMWAGSTGSRGAATREASGRRAVRRKVVIVGLALMVRIRERAAARALCGDPPNMVYSRSGIRPCQNSNSID
ncbi:hypothetical protein [Streptomyces sp. NPDC054834]